MGTNNLLETAQYQITHLCPQQRTILDGLKKAMTIQSGYVYPGKVKMSKGELNVQSKCHENENSSPSLSLQQER
jgi:hypothetical protein